MSVSISKSAKPNANQTYYINNTYPGVIKHKLRLEVYKDILLTIPHLKHIVDKKIIKAYLRFRN